MSFRRTRTRRRRRSRTLFVTGGTGFLGRHIVSGPNADGWEVVAPGRTSLDLRYRDTTLDTIRGWKPDAIIHTAYRRGDRASTYQATEHVAAAARACGARLVHVSTDALFAGRDAPYGEADDPDPITEYGRDKADCEAVVLETCPDALVIRTSLLLGRDVRSSHEQMVIDAITGRTATRFFIDEHRCPVIVDDLAAELSVLAGRRELTGVLHLGGPDVLSRAELAVMIARRTGHDPARLGLDSLEASGIVRPGRVVLDSSLARSHGIAVRGPSSWE